MHTVLTLNTPTILSHSVPLFGYHPSSFERALARRSTRSRTSKAEYSVPVSPQINRALALLNGRRPYFSLSINSEIDMESGGSKGKGSTQSGGEKTIPIVVEVCSRKIPSRMQEAQMPLGSRFILLRRFSSPSC